MSQKEKRPTRRKILSLFLRSGQQSHSGRSSANPITPESSHGRAVVVVQDNGPSRAVEGARSEKDLTPGRPIEVLAGSQNTVVGTLAVNTEVGRDSYTITNTTNNYFTSSTGSREPLGHHTAGIKTPSEQSSTPLASVPAISQWLNAPNFIQIYQSVLSERMENTGEWFLRSDEFQQFIQGERVFLWATGMPGSGKSVLSGTSVEHLLDRFESQDGVVVAFAFLRYTEKHSTASILASLLAQLVQSSDRAHALVSPIYQRRSKSGAAPMRKDVEKLLREATQSLDKVYIAIDGLDEAEEEVKDGLLRVLTSLRANVLITSRPLELYYKQHTPTALSMSIQARTEDIGIYVDERIRQNARLRSILSEDPTAAERLRTLIKEKSQGMFILARLQMDAISQTNSLNALFKAAEDLPSGLQEMYQRTMERINAQPAEDVSIAHRVFLWLLKAGSDNPDTIRHALAVSIDPPFYDERNVVPLDVVLSKCGGLVVWKNDLGPLRDHGLRFVHFTTQEFMKQLVFDDFPKPYSYLSATCLIRVLQFTQGTQLGDAFSGLPDDADPFLPFAAYNWPLYVKASKEEGCLHPFVLSVVMDQRPALYTASITHPAERIWGIASGLQLAAFLNLADIIATRLLPSSDATMGGLLAGLNAFHVAATMINVEALEELCLHYAEAWDDRQNVLQLNARDAKGRTPLMLCMDPSRRKFGTFPHEGLMPMGGKGKKDLQVDWSPTSRAVRTLLSQPQIDINIQDERGATAFLYACHSWHAGGFVKDPPPSNSDLLISYFPTTIDMGVSESYGDTALHGACSNASPSTVRWILEGHPELRGWIRLANESGSTPLILACAQSSNPFAIPRILEIVKLLFKFDPFLNVNHQDCRGFTALFYACSVLRHFGTTPPLPLIDYLLAVPHIDVNVQDEMGATALYHILTSERGGHMQHKSHIQRFLAVKGFKIRRHRAVLKWACGQCHSGCTAEDGVSCFDFLLNLPGWTKNDIYQTLFKSFPTLSSGWRIPFWPSSVHCPLAAVKKHIEGGAFSDHNIYSILLLAKAFRSRCRVYLRLLLHHFDLLQYPGIANLPEFCECQGCEPYVPEYKRMLASGHIYLPAVFDY